MDVRYGELEVPTPEETEIHLAQRELLIRRPKNEAAQDLAKMFNNSFLSDVTFLGAPED